MRTKKKPRPYLYFKGTAGKVVWRMPETGTGQIRIATTDHWAPTLLTAETLRACGYSEITEAEGTFIANEPLGRTSAYIAGRVAHEEHFGMSANPHAAGSADFREWDAGWLHSNQEQEDEIAADEERAAREEERAA